MLVISSVHPSVQVILSIFVVVQTDINLLWSPIYLSNGSEVPITYK